ncbi:hypothetical protein AGMMS4957_22410 [Bacteroidia bacterium]|nr:hypothetical protein AGMMS4957_22410 [Bacteroidia bacterium]
MREFAFHREVINRDLPLNPYYTRDVFKVGRFYLTLLNPAERIYYASRLEEKCREYEKEFHVNEDVIKALNMNTSEITEVNPQIQTRTDAIQWLCKRGIITENTTRIVFDENEFERSGILIKIYF